MITKVAVENVASRKAVTKAGFVEVALMRHDKRGPRARVEVEVRDGAAMGQRLRRRLQR
jgi:RimJ/RimL family protein N-acetyltransferase